MSTLLLLLLMQAQTNVPKGSISGTIVDSVSGAPIRKAQVIILNFAANVVVTDASGSFLFDQVPPGSYVIRATHPDYPQGQTPGFGHASLQLAAGERKSGVALKLAPTAVLSGRVSDEDGDPLANCSVNLFVNKQSLSVVIRGASTSRNGEYQLRPVPAGKYYLEARCPAPVLQPRPFLPPHAAPPGPQLGYSTRFYPGTREFSGAQPMKIAEGQMLNGLDFQMSPEPVSSLTVHIAGVAAARVTATLTPDDGSTQRQTDIITASIARSGEVHFQAVPIRRYVLRINSSTPEHLLLAKQVVTVGEDPGEITVPVAAPIPLTGTLHWGDTKSQAPNRLSLYQMGEVDVHISTDIKPDGSFAFRGVSPGRYQIFNLGTVWIQSVSIGGERTDGPEFELEPGASGPMDIVTGSERGTVSGDIDMGSAHPAKVTIIATFGYTQTEWPDATVVPARYTASLPPGEYKFYAVEVFPGINFATLLDRDVIISRGERVDIRANSQTVKTLRLITAEEIERAAQ